MDYAASEVSSCTRPLILMKVTLQLCYTLLYVHYPLFYIYVWYFSVLSCFHTTVVGWYDLFNVFVKHISVFSNYNYDIFEVSFSAYHRYRPPLHLTCAVFQLFGFRPSTDSTFAVPPLPFCRLFLAHLFHIPAFLFSSSICLFSCRRFSFLLFPPPEKNFKFFFLLTFW